MSRCLMDNKPLLLFFLPLWIFYWLEKQAIYSYDFEMSINYKQLMTSDK